MSELGKPFLKKSDTKLKKKQKLGVKKPHENKTPLARNENLVHTKNRPRRSY